MGGILPQLNKSLNVQKIAVLRRNGIGDLLTCVPMLHVCKQLYPKAKITLIIEERARDCAEMIELPPWDELWILSRGNKYLAALKMAYFLRKERFDLIIGAKPKTMKLQSFLLALSGATFKRAVCHTPKRGLEFFINEPVSADKIACMEHQALQVMALVEDQPQMRAQYWPVFKKKEACSGKNEFFTIYLNITNNRPSSRLCPQQMKKVFQKLGRPFCVVLGGLISDRELADRWLCVLSQDPQLKLKVCLSQSFEQTCKLLYQSDLVITGDGGLMHMAAACQRPLIALFGQTSIKRWSPLTSTAQLLFHPNRVDAIEPLEITRVLETFIRT